MVSLASSLTNQEIHTTAHAEMEEHTTMELFRVTMVYRIKVAISIYICMCIYMMHTSMVLQQAWQPSMLLLSALICMKQDQLRISNDHADNMQLYSQLQLQLAASSCQQIMACTYTLLYNPSKLSTFKDRQKSQGSQWQHYSGDI